MIIIKYLIEGEDKLKIKVLPEDFIVKEEVNLEILPKGEYKIYMLIKKHWNTTDAISFISREKNVPIEEIGAGGRKDRHAVTYQYISVPKKYNINFNKENVRTEFVGFADDFVSTAVLKGNYFELVVRKINHENTESISKRIEEVRKNGYPNYFDDQRFGSVSNEYEFIGEEILKKHLNGALKLYFTISRKEDTEEEKERKEKIFKSWKNLNEVMTYCKNGFEKEMIYVLMKGKSRQYLLEALNLIPREEISMFFSAYQAYIWNRTLTEVLTQNISDLKAYKGKIRDYMIYEELSPEILLKLNEIVIPTVGDDISEENKFVYDTILKILEEREVKLSDFNLRKFRKVFYKSFLRKAIVFPENLEVSDFEKDDFYKDYLKLTLKFKLPPGSFATMFIKSLGIDIDFKKGV